MVDEKIKNKNKRKLIENTNNLMTYEFGNIKPSEITPERLGLFLDKLNPFVQKYAHDVVKKHGTPAHVERKLVKNSARLIVFQELGKKYPEQVIEYLFKKSHKIKLRGD